MPPLAVITMHIKPLCLVVCFSLGALACSQDPEIAKHEALARGNAFFDGGKYHEASIEYRQAVQLDPRFGEARNRLAETYLKIDDARGAYREIVRAADLLPNDIDVQLRAGTFLLAAGQFEDARARADRALTLAPRHAAAHVLRANALAGLKDLDGALKELETAISVDPDSGRNFVTLGAIQEARGQQAEAEAAYARAIAVDAASVPARVAYANYLLVGQRLDEAETQLKAALASNPSDRTVNRALATFYMLQRRLADAEPYLKTLAANADGGEAQFTLARLYLASNRRQEAIELLNQMAAVKETAADATLMLARIAFSDGQRAEGYRRVNEVLATSANHPAAMLLNAEFKLADGRAKEAAADAQRAIDGDPRLVAAHFVLGEARTAMKDYEAAKNAFNAVLAAEPRSLRAQLALSRLHLLTGSHDLAQQFADRAASAQPAARDPKAAVVRAALARRDLRRAESELKALMAAFPEHADNFVLEGSLRLLQQNASGAEAAFRRALALDSGSSAAATGLVRVLFATKRQDEARTFVERRVVARPRDADAHTLAARTHASFQDVPQAERSLRTVLELDPARLEAYTMLGQLYARQGKVNEAIAEFQKVAAQKPDSVAAHTLIGLLFEQQKRFGEAKETYRKALAIDPSAAVAANNLAWLYTEANENLDEALQLAQTARAKLADSPDVADTLGWVYHRKGLATQAVPLLKESVEGRPETPLFTYHLGLAYAKTGELALARKTLERALQLEPTSSYATEARAELNRLATLGS